MNPSVAVPLHLPLFTSQKLISLGGEDGGGGGDEDAN